MGDESDSITPLMQAIVDKVPPPPGDASTPFQLRVHNVLHDEYVGRIAIGRIASGVIRPNQGVVHLDEEGSRQEKTGPLFGFQGNKRVRVEEATAGDIVAVAGIEAVQIGDTLADPARPERMSRIDVEEPTIKIRFLINSSPVRRSQWEVGDVSTPARSPVSGSQTQPRAAGGRKPIRRTPIWCLAEAS